MHTNELIDETSPYLLQHAHNPVQWHAWNAQNLKEAGQIGKPLLISIGYSSCHWCHVMEKESFEDEEVAAFMNANFYCIKVDREERPDVDQLYMSAANIITRKGGWPLNCFALPDGRPFHAGTYFPKDAWLRLLGQVVHQFNEARSKLEDYAQRLTLGIRLQETAISDNTAQTLDFTIIRTGIEEWKSQWDSVWGGLDRAPKFPMPSNLSFLLKFSDITNDANARDLAHLTLKKMGYGGIYDQIGGGFSRYSTDVRWKVPHFEKMLYDNGQLLGVYALAYRQRELDMYPKIIAQTVDWLEREMMDETGLFYSALDADSEGEEGKFYTWTEQEMQVVLGDEYPFAKAYYGVENEGKWEDVNILMRIRDDNEWIEQWGLSSEEFQNRIKSFQTKLFKIREKRTRPGLDDKCLTSWNALLITGLCEAYTSTNEKRYLNRAKTAFAAIRKLLEVDKRLFHSYKQGKSTIDGMLEDYCYIIAGALSLFEVTGKTEYAEYAYRMTEVSIDLFYDTEKELFYFNPKNELVIRTCEVYDNVIPSSNAAMAHVLYKVGLLFGRSPYIAMSGRLIGKVQENMKGYMGGHSHWAEAHMMHSATFYEVVVTGPKAKQGAMELRRSLPSYAWVTFVEQETDIFLYRDRFHSDHTLYYVCTHGACQLPDTTPQEVIARISHGE